MGASSGGVTMTGPLQTLEVVELSQGVPGAYCGKLLADLGAEVIAAEPPAGSPVRRLGPFPGDEPHPERSALFVYLNNNKLGVTLDIRSAPGRELVHKLLATASILVTDLPVPLLRAAHLDHEALLTAYPKLIVTQVTPFGLSGPRAHYKTADLVSFHMSGYGHATPGDVADPEREPPLKAGGRQADLAAGLTAAVGTMHAVFTRLRTGRGQVVDVSRQESLISFNILNLATYSFSGQVPVRQKGGRRSAAAVAARLPCSDGWVNFVAMTDDQWDRMVAVLGRPEWSMLDVFSDRFKRAENWDALEPLLFEETRRFKKADLVALCQANRIPCLPSNSIADVVGSPQLAARGFFTAITHPGLGDVTMPRNPLLFSGTPTAIRRPAPTLGQDNESVFGGRLGMPEGDLQALRAAGVI